MNRPKEIARKFMESESSKSSPLHEDSNDVRVAENTWRGILKDMVRSYDIDFHEDDDPNVAFYVELDTMGQGSGIYVLVKDGNMYQWETETGRPVGYGSRDIKGALDYLVSQIMPDIVNY